MALSDNYMTIEEQAAKYQIKKKLAEDGYAPYAKILELFDVKIPTPEELQTKLGGTFVAAMEPAKARIIVNPELNIDQVSFITRHEILHGYLNHEKRLLDKLAQEKGIKPEELYDLTLAELKQELYSNPAFNIAGDYEISNLGYTDADKKIARAIDLNGQILCGLVTEDEHPDWVDLSIEEMYDKLREMKDQLPPSDGKSFMDDTSDDYDLNKSLKDAESESEGSSGGQQSDSDGGYRIIKGTFKDGKFYDLDGNEVTH